MGHFVLKYNCDDEESLKRLNEIKSKLDENNSKYVEETESENTKITLALDNFNKLKEMNLINEEDVYKKIPY